jgi:hypothetical protein
MTSRRRRASAVWTIDSQSDDSPQERVNSQIPSLVTIARGSVSGCAAGAKLALDSSTPDLRVADHDRSYPPRREFTPPRPVYGIGPGKCDGETSPQWTPALMQRSTSASSVGWFQAFQKSACNVSPECIADRYEPLFVVPGLYR